MLHLCLRQFYLIGETDFTNLKVSKDSALVSSYSLCKSSHRSVLHWCSQVSSDLKLLPQENEEQQAIFAEQKR
jgi:hypothetical protein